MKKKWRLKLIFVFFILFAAAIISRLIIVQVLDCDYYRALAQGQEKNLKVLKGERGEVFFRGGEVLATNIEEKYLFVSPLKIKDKEKTADILSQITGLDKNFILERIRRNSLFEKIKDGLSKEEEEEIKNKKLIGVYIGEKKTRIYPQNEIASHLIGFLDKDGNGQYGIEGYYDDILQGGEIILKDNNFLKVNKAKGKSIFLTLDYNIQFKAEELLLKAKKEFEIKSGQIIVVNPFSGEILAMAEFPNFNPNNYSKIKDYSIFQNSAVQKLFEPGSVFKVITMAAALNEKKVSPQTTYFDLGYVKIGENIIRNYDNRSFGEQTMTNVLEKSINTGAVFAEEAVGSQKFLEYIEKFGFFEPTGIDLPGEIYSQNIELKKGREINFATASFGQGIEVTPIQLIRAFSAIANGGKLVKPYIVEKFVDGKRIEKVTPEISSQQVISQETASQLTAMLVSVVKNGPYTRRARIPGYYIAGKTGTAQVPWTSLGIKKKGYSSETWQSFIGFAPAFNPKFLVLVKLDFPNTSSSEYSAVPIFREMAKYIIDYKQIPQDYTEDEE